jgi:putative transposase
MVVLKALQYRLYPTKEQQRLLTRQLEECRWLWNTLLAERKQVWEERHETVDYYAQKAELPGLKAGARPTKEMPACPSIMCSGLFRRCIA